MKIFGWMQNKLNAKFGCNTLHSISVNHHPPKQEIGAKEEFSDWPHGLLAIGTFGNTKNVKEEEDQVDQEKQEFTVEEVEKLEKEINLLLEDDKSVVLGGGKAVNNVDNTISNSINKKSFSFLLKKMFVCRAEFTPTLNLRDQVPESRIDKILRAILHKKIYPQNSNASNSSTKKVLQKKHEQIKDDEDDDDDDKRSKWVKTDSEYIVLEI
ncbi:Protein DEEPER ROOTING 1 [Euphorbia peplus]|nr:Protein DEEPER ROOTING 1 [Euphorbia peplus]